MSDVRQGVVGNRIEEYVGVAEAEIEIQAELWRHNTGNWPAANLATIGADVSYFPGGLPTCPVDESAYTIDTSTGLVIGHNH